jgi:hypothetical protein
MPKRTENLHLNTFLSTHIHISTIHERHKKKISPDVSPEIKATINSGIATQCNIIQA